MSGDRSTRNALAAIFLVAALFVAMNLVISGAPVLDWWVPLVLVVIGLVFAFLPNFGLRSSPEAAPDADLALPQLPANIHDYEVSSYGAATVEGVLPFPDASVTIITPRETPVSPETPAPLIEPQPEVETPPMSPETPAPAAEPEPETVPMSPETPTPDADVSTEVVDEGPSQKLPVDRTIDTGQPAPELKHTARTEYANPDEAVAKREPPPPPAPDDSVTATDRQPETEVVAEKTSAPQQPYEAEKVGEITPERAERVINGDDTDAPVVTEAASPRVAAQEINGEGSVGSGDELTKIDGIGEKSAAALRAAGIDSYQTLANSSADTLRDAISTAGVRLVGDVETWAQQASYAARGDWEGLENFNRERKAPKA